MHYLTEFNDKQMEMIPKELYLEILNSCGLSQTMKEHLEKQDLSKHDLIKLLVNAPVALTKKLTLLEQIAETEDLYEEMLEQVNRLLPGEKGHLREWQSVWARSATRIEEEIRKAIDALQVGEGEFFWMEEHWFDYEWLDEKNGGGRAFQSLDAALQAIRNMMQEEEWDDATECWTELTKWTPGENGVMENLYRYYLIRDEIVFFGKKTDGPRALGYHDPYRFVFPTEDVCCSTPFQPGDIVTLDPRPFAPPIHAVLLQTRRDCCGLRGLCCSFDGSWNDVAIYHRHGWDEITGYEPILSPVYRLSLCSFDDLLPDEREVLQSVHNYIGGNEVHGDEVDRLFFVNHSMETEEVLEKLHKMEKEIQQR